MHITQTTQPPWTVLTLGGKIDNAGSEELKAALLPLMNGGAVALDFTNVEYITSSGFRVLMVAQKQQQAAKGRLLLGNMSDPLRHFFDMAGLSTVFRITSDFKQALAEGT